MQISFFVINWPPCRKSCSGALIQFQQFLPSKSALPIAGVTSLLTAVVILLVWLPERAPDRAMEQFGQSMVQTIAHTSAGHLLHQDRIELAVVANEVATYPEVSGIVFYNANNEILAMAGGTDLRRHHTSAATLDDTITGYVALDLNAQAFTPPIPWWAWLATLAAVVLVPVTAVFAVGAVLRSQNDTRSLPIVTVPEPQRVPVDADDDLEAEPRVPQPRPS